ncbi:hypothetical protein DFH07DRAFT_1032183 [Mycena maculata]|uniref:Uncharacterized protein n=1 Tax=Mycena maculata TaxID=230809 RepID=A0AAD7IWA6_9AGAR|nr:hypothetical protein DFH07DRAFT_1032183 [Mycena maculata]
MIDYLTYYEAEDVVIFGAPCSTEGQEWIFPRKIWIYWYILDSRCQIAAESETNNLTLRNGWYPRHARKEYMHGFLAPDKVSTHDGLPWAVAHTPPAWLELLRNIRICEPPTRVFPEVCPAILFVIVSGFDGSRESPPTTSQPLQKLFAGLTLPSLTHLKIGASEHPSLVLPWPHSLFISLSRRSSFHHHLKSLCLYPVAIPEAELLECLATLPELERLSISDHPSTLGNLLITDTLLEALTWTPSCLFPKLSFLDLGSMLKFDDNIYLKFLLSRVDGAPFGANLSPLRGYERELDSTSGREYEHM